MSITTCTRLDYRETALYTYQRNLKESNDVHPH